jgi:stage II sporulation protein P
MECENDRAAPNELELLCVRPGAASDDYPRDKPDISVEEALTDIETTKPGSDGGFDFAPEPVPFARSAAACAEPYVERQPKLFKRMIVTVICAFMMISAPSSFGDFVQTAAENSGISSFIVSLETGAHGDSQFLPSDFLASLTAKRLLSAIIPDFDLGKSSNGTGDSTTPPGGENDDYSLDVPVNQGYVKSSVPRIDTDALGSGSVKTLTINPTSPAGYDFYNGIFILNGTSNKLDIAALLSSDIAIGKKTVEPSVLIVHTHTSEAYTPTALDSYVTTANDRCGDINYNVVRVGTEIANFLESKGIGVIHLKDFYDTSYDGAYDRSLAAVQKCLDENPSIKVVLDIHRDALNSADSPKYKLVTEINGKTSAQLMLLVGSNRDGDNPGWQENLKLAVQVQDRMVRKYPLLARPIKLTNGSYNQFVADCALLIEVGTNGNSLDEAIYAGKLFASCLSEVLLSIFA